MEKLKELSNELIEDGQPERAISEYLLDVYSQVKNIPIITTLKFSKDDENTEELVNSASQEWHTVNSEEFIKILETSVWLFKRSVEDWK